jgi:hypothetical protein
MRIQVRIFAFVFLVWLISRDDDVFWVLGVFVLFLGRVFLKEYFLLAFYWPIYASQDHWIIAAFD